MYGKLIDGVLKRSKSYLIWNGRKYWNAPAEMWIAAGWKHIVYGEYPEVEDIGEVTIEYTEDDEHIFVNYIVEVDEDESE